MDRSEGSESSNSRRDKHSAVTHGCVSLIFVDSLSCNLGLKEKATKRDNRSLKFFSALSGIYLQNINLVEGTPAVRPRWLRMRRLSFIREQYQA
jgi:hypothetical protein